MKRLAAGVLIIVAVGIGLAPASHAQTDPIAPDYSDVATSAAPATTIPTADSTLLATTVPLNSADARLACDTEIVDPQHRLDAAQFASVIDQLKSKDVMLRVRVETSVDGGADERQAQLKRECTGWMVGGDLAPKLLSLIVLPDKRQTGIYYGREWSALQSHWADIQNADMNPRFREGDYTGGLVGGLSSIYRVLDGSYGPLPRYIDPATNQPGVVQPAIYVPGQPEGGSGSGFAGFIVLVLVVVMGMNVLGFVKNGKGQSAPTYLTSRRSWTSGTGSSWFGSSGSSSGSSWGRSSSGSSADSGGSSGGGGSGGSSGGGSTSW